MYAYILTQEQNKLGCLFQAIFFMLVYLQVRPEPITSGAPYYHKIGSRALTHSQILDHPQKLSGTNTVAYFGF